MFIDRNDPDCGAEHFGIGGVNNGMLQVVDFLVSESILGAMLMLGKYERDFFALFCLVMEFRVEKEILIGAGGCVGKKKRVVDEQTALPQCCMDVGT